MTWVKDRGRIMKDEIHILGLELPVLIGVPEEERAVWQMVSADIRLGLSRGFDEMRDEVEDTVNYADVALQAKALAAARSRKLLETLAAELIGLFLENELVCEAEVTLRKRILPGTDAVAVRMKRGRTQESDS